MQSAAWAIDLPGVDNDFEVVGGQVRIENSGAIHLTEDTISECPFYAGDRRRVVPGGWGGPRPRLVVDWDRPPLGLGQEYRASGVVKE